MSEQLALLPEYLTAHLQLTLLALILSALVSLPLGIAVTRVRWLQAPVLAVAGVIQTVPGLALLAVMVPVLAAMNLPSIGFLPAIVGLTLYGLFPILRNTVTGLAGVDPALKEAAQAVGMTTRQQLVRVELPLAMPVIIAGIRTATVWLVGMTTLSTPVGATSLGNYIFSGLQTRNYTAVMVGCVAAAALAMVLDATIRAIEQGVMHRRRRALVASGATVGMLVLYVVVSLGAPILTSRERPIVIGSKTFTEQYIVSAILAAWVEQETGRSTKLIQSLGSLVAFDALEAGEIDAYVDYSGTLWANVMGRTDAVSSRELLRSVETYLREERDITIAATLGFENAYALAVRAGDADRLGLRSISDLTLHASNMAIGGDYEFFARPEWGAIRDLYDLSFAERRTMDSTLMYQAVAQRNVDVISAFSSDGRVEAYDLTLLDDDLDAIPPYDAVVLVGARVARELPDVITALNRLDRSISVDAIRTMNLAVDEAGRHPSVVATEFVRTLYGKEQETMLLLKLIGLADPASPSGRDPDDARRKNHRDVR